MGKIIRNGINYGGTYEDATSVNYDGAASGLEARTVQEAVDEVQSNVSALNNSLGNIHLVTMQAEALEAYQRGEVTIDISSYGFKKPPIAFLHDTYICSSAVAELTTEKFSVHIFNLFHNKQSPYAKYYLMELP